jgi:hypothetical protein
MSKDLKDSILQKKSQHTFSDIPDGYFESLPVKLMQKIDREKSHGLAYFGQKLAAIALILIVAAGLLFLMFNSRKPTNLQFAFSNTIVPDTIRKSEPKIKKALLNDSTIADYQNAENLISDSLSFENLSDEEILQYLLESEEFEF